MKIRINGIDYSRFFYRYGLTEQPVKRYGKNGGAMLSGIRTVDLIAVKSTVTITCNPLTTEQKDELKAVCAEAYVRFEYAPDGEFDEWTCIDAIPAMSAASVKLVANKKTYWAGITVTMEER